MSNRVLRSTVVVAVLAVAMAAPAAAAERPAASSAWRAGIAAAARIWFGEWLGWGLAPESAAPELTVVTGDEGHGIDPNGLQVGGTQPGSATSGTGTSVTTLTPPQG